MNASMTRFASTLVAIAALGLAACDQKAPAGKPAPAAPPAPTSAKLRVAVIPKGTTHEFWKGVERGARKAGDELGVEIIWKGPPKEDDTAQQIQVVQQFVADKVSAIVLAPLNDTALLGQVQQAAAAGIPVAIIDSALKGTVGTDFIGYYGTDNRAAGASGGKHLASIIKAAGGTSAVLLRYTSGSASTTQREEGALEALKAAGVTMASDNQYGEVTPESAKTKALQMIDTVKAAGGVFTVNESTTLGMLLALRQAGLAGKVQFVGFDASPPLVEALRAGEIHALVVQNPERMGEIGVQQAVRKARGEKAEPQIDTGAVLVTKSNMDSPEVKGLLPAAK
jgi:ribose transport system substrate-binding protein